MWPPKCSDKYKEWIKHLSESQKGKPARNKGIPMSEKQKELLRILNTGENNPNYGLHRSDETRRKQSEAQKGKPKSDQHRKNMSKVRKVKFVGEGNPFYGKHHSTESRKQMSESHKGVHPTEEQRKRMSESHKKRCANPSVRLAMKERMLGERSHLWKGGVSFAPYCFKFNRDFKSRCRAFYNYTCIECGTPENGSKHIVHHVNYDKEICCNTKEPLFVLLCRSCHAKANFNREYWERHYTEMIMGYYEGKCYFTKEEMLAFSITEI